VPCALEQDEKSATGVSWDFHRPSVHLHRLEEYLKFFCRTYPPMYLSNNSMMSYKGCMRFATQSQQLIVTYHVLFYIGAQALDTHRARHAASATPAALLSLKAFVRRSIQSSSAGTNKKLFIPLGKSLWGNPFGEIPLGKSLWGTACNCNGNINLASKSHASHASHASSGLTCLTWLDFIAHGSKA